MKNSVSGNQQANGQVREPKKGEKIFSASSKFVKDMGDALKRAIKGQRYAIYSFQEAIFEALTVKDDETLYFVNDTGSFSPESMETNGRVYLGDKLISKQIFDRGDRFGFVDYISDCIKEVH